jgi:bacteriocin biosynthesis cyclodehydratase domain-containing protein
MGVVFTLNPLMPVLLRPDGFVQVGWDPRRAVLVRTPGGLSPDGLAALLRMMQARIGMDKLLARARDLGLEDGEQMVDVVRQLVAANLVSRSTRPRSGPSSIRIRVHGNGPLSDVVVSALRCSGARVRQTYQRGATAADADLVVLTDYLVVDPALVRELHATATPHLLVRVRDGTGLVGPMVVPGVTSCLRCADLHRSDHDCAWPAVAAQLRDTVGTADRATVLATAALAVNQVDRVLRAIRGGEGTPPPGPPPTLDTTLEFDVGASSIVARQWSRHPRCSC